MIMSEERFWNTDEYASKAKFAVHDGAMTMRQAGRIFRLDPAPPKSVRLAWDSPFPASAVAKGITH